MKNQFLWILIALLVLLILINFFMPTSYYDGETSSSSAPPVFNKAFVQILIDQDNEYRQIFFSPQSTAVLGERTPFPNIHLTILNKLMTLSDTQFEKLNLIASKTYGLPPPRESTYIRIFKLLFAGDISGFLNSFSDSDVINEDVIVSRAQQFSGPDIVVYRQAIDLLLSDLLLTDPRATEPQIGNIIFNDLVILKNLDDTRLTRFMYLVENRFIQPAEALIIISSPQFPGFMNEIMIANTDFLNRDYIVNLLSETTSSSTQVSTMVTNINSYVEAVTQTVVKQVTTSSSGALKAPALKAPALKAPAPRAPALKAPAPKAPAPKAPAPTSYRTSVKKVQVNCRPKGSWKFWLKKCPDV